MRGKRENNWKLKVKVSPEHLEGFSDALETISPVILFNEIEKGKDKGLWNIEAISQEKPQKEKIVSALSVASLLYNIEIPEYELSDFEEKDWLKESLISFPPVNVGGFYIYGSHIKEEPPKGVIPIKIDAATAFGSGEHPTTKGCLLALEDVMKKQEKSKYNILDMGCGSGVLSLGVAKMADVDILAVDIDEEAVRVTKENAEENNVSKSIVALAGDGYNLEEVSKRAPYDIILANILARPLVDMAEDLCENLKKGGYAILSGLLDEQQDWVAQSHEDLGLKELGVYKIDGWVALLMQK